VVLPRSTAGEAIDVITRAIVGKQASSGERVKAWEILRDVSGYRVVRIAPARPGN